MLVEKEIPQYEKEEKQITKGTAAIVTIVRWKDAS